MSTGIDTTTLVAGAGIVIAGVVISYFLILKDIRASIQADPKKPISRGRGILFVCLSLLAAGVFGFIAFLVLLIIALIIYPPSE